METSEPSGRVRRGFGGDFRLNLVPGELLPGVAGELAAPVVALRADRNIQACLDQHASLAIGTPATQGTSTASQPVARR